MKIVVYIGNFLSIVEPHVYVLSQSSKVFLAGKRILKLQLHVGLPARKPNLAYHNVAKNYLAAVSVRPFTANSGCLCVIASYLNFHLGKIIGVSPNGDIFIPL